MAKLFLTLEETARKLQKTPNEVRLMAQQGILQEFRDRDKLMFKVAQVDLLVSGDPGDSGCIPLVEDEPAECSGISIFEADSTDDIPSHESSSGLLDLTREADDSALGLNLLEEVSQDQSLGRGTVFKTSQRPSTQGRFNNFTAEERNLIRLGLSALRAARKEDAASIGDLERELDSGLPTPKRGWLSWFKD